MAFGMSPFPLQFGTRQGGGGDPTAITPANADAFLASLGLTQAGTGTTWGESGQAVTPLYDVAAGKVPLAVETIGGKKYFGPIVNPAGTNLALRDRDLTNAAWVKTGCTPTLQVGSLGDAAEADGHSLLTATADNATCIQAITSSSGERVTKFWVQTDDEDVFVSDGKPTGSALYEDAFGSDTSGEWSGGQGFVDGTITVAGGKLVYTKGANDDVDVRIVRAVSVTTGKTYLQNGTVGKTGAGTAYIIFDHLATGGGSPFRDSATAGPLYKTATLSTIYVSIALIGGSTGDTVTLDDVSVYEVEETTVTPGSSLEIETTAYTGANPQLAIRIANNGDSVRVYGVQHQVAARPLRPYIGPTAASTVTVGARTLNRTGLSASEVDLDLVMYGASPALKISFMLALDNNNMIVIYLFSTRDPNNYVVEFRRSGTQRWGLAIPPDAAQKVSIQWNDTVMRARLNDGAWTSLTYMAPPTMTNLEFGRDAIYFNSWASAPILAFRDNIGNLLDGKQGWNHRLIDTWSA